jgi:hypothetical protein
MDSHSAMFSDLWQQAGKICVTLTVNHSKLQFSVFLRGFPDVSLDSGHAS